MLSSPFEPDIGFQAIPISRENLAKLNKSELSLVNSFTSQKRRLEFASGRLALRKAAAQLKLDLSMPILISESGLPALPTDLLCSVSHSNNIVAAAIGKKADLFILSLDIEFCRQNINLNIAKKILLDNEHRWVFKNNHGREERLLRIFSAKECVYKGVSHLLNQSLYFKDVSCHWSETEEFSCTVDAAKIKAFKAGHAFKVKSKKEKEYICSSLAIYR